MTEGRQLDVGSFFASLQDKKNRDQLHTSCPGQVVSYNAATRTAKIKPAINKADGKEVIEYPILSDVKVQFPHGAGWGMSFDLNSGDKGMLFFSEVSIAEWIKTGQTNITPKSKRHHHISDAFFVPGIHPDADLPVFTHSGEGITIANDLGTRKFTLSTLGASILGNLSVAGNITATGNITSGGTITATVDVVVAGLSVLNHAHDVSTVVTNAEPVVPGPVTGQGTTGGAIPLP